ncbi:hypothetical protein GL4_1177 [Methyloceanibacter caenitepidi]|uniref:Uncharacterized protein n=1 Tax=Methyloceanibacter caenitepidi TaxID=1384459 RepID=A0A0A8K139_9HYPH|nr:hypothetical protein GL4_1177 [Methyloceanibacter caenitepidi]
MVDQDGATWVSHPLCGQALFALDRLGDLAPQQPEWKNTEPFIRKCRRKSNTV